VAGQEQQDVELPLRQLCLLAASEHAPRGGVDREVVELERGLDRWSGVDSAEHGVDTLHEEAGAAWLEEHFVPRVTEPLRLHVLAKRYLCAVEPSYLAALSPASALSLGLQGGPCTADEVAAFERNPFADEAVRLRRWDDVGKIEGLVTPPLSHYRPALRAGLRSATREPR